MGNRRARRERAAREARHARRETQGAPAGARSRPREATGDPRAAHAPQAAGPAASRRPRLASVLFLAALALAAYFPSLHNDFIWDDPQYVTQNQTLRSAEGLKQIWFGLDLENMTCVTPQYYPMVFTSFWIEYHLIRLDPFWYHAVNVLLHAGCAVLVFVILRRLALPGAWLAAAIFAVHPVHVETVAWITERKNVLSGLFYLGAALAYLRFALPAGAESDESAAAAPRKWSYFSIALLLFVLALLAKTVAATLPAALVVVLWWKKGRIEGRDVAPLLPFFVIGMGLGLLTASLEELRVGAQGEEWSLSPVERILLAGRVLWFYAAKLVYPAGLVFVYPRFEIDASAWWQYLFPLAASGVVVALWIHKPRIGRGPLAAALFFAGTLFPALGFFNVYPMRFSYVADHFQYLASIGLIAAAACLAVRAAARLRLDKSPLGPCLAGLLLASLAALTCRHAEAFDGQETLWRHTLERNPEAWIAHNNLAEIVLAQGKVDEAIALCESALRLKPDLPEALGNLANCLYARGRFEDAIARYDQLVPLTPEPDKAASALSNRGAALEALGRLDEAVASHNRALRLNPASATAHFNLGIALSKLERTGEAEQHFAEAVRLAPGFGPAHYRRGLCLESQGRIEAALSAFDRAVSVQPGLVEAANCLAWLLATRPEATTFDVEEAVRIAKTACQQTSSRHPGLLDTLAAAHGRAGRFDEAVPLAERALELARISGQDALALRIEARLQMYRAGRPCVGERQLD